MKSLWDTRSGRAFVIALVALLLTATVALWPVTNTYGTDCGSWIGANDTKAAVQDAESNSDYASTALTDAVLGNGYSPSRTTTQEVDACHAARATRTPVVAIFGLITVALLISGAALKRNEPEGRATPKSGATPTS